MIWQWPHRVLINLISIWDKSRFSYWCLSKLRLLGCSCRVHPSRGHANSVTLWEAAGLCDFPAEREMCSHLMNLSNTAAQSELSFSTSMLLLRLSSISSNMGLCRDRTREWTWITFTSSALGVSTLSDTSLPFAWTSRASRRCTRAREWLMVSPPLPSPSWAPSAFWVAGWREKGWSQWTGNEVNLHHSY